MTQRAVAAGKAGRGLFEGMNAGDRRRESIDAIG